MGYMAQETGDSFVVGQKQRSSQYRGSSVAEGAAEQHCFGIERS